MKQGLALSQGLQQTLAPQLQHAIKLLQFSALELTQEIQRLMETNPLLEMDEPKTQAEDGAERQVTAVSVLPPRGAVGGAAIRSYADDANSVENTVAESQTLADYLLWQMNLAHFNAEDEMIARAVIDAIDEDGYCRDDMPALQMALANQGQTVTLAAIDAVLARLQQFDPIGVAARSIQECLLLQLDVKSPQPGLDDAKQLLTHHSHLLGRLNTLQLAKKMKRSPAQMQQALKLIQSLNPRPGTIIGQAAVDYVIPDVVCEQRMGYWSVYLNEAISPGMSLNQNYVNLLRGSSNPRDSQFMRDNLREARWFLKSLQTRNHTLLRVAQCIIERQQAFLEHGEQAMQPMILQDIASQCEVHESTVSRVTTQKYMHTPRGIYELKYFFSSHVKNKHGQTCSATAVRSHIKRYISQECTEKPLSDSKLAAKLADEKNIDVARRTITKYREAMGIASSNERRFASMKG